MHRIILLAGSVLVGVLRAAAQQPVVLTLEGALERARREAPAVVAARMRIDEARGRLLGASPSLSSNPTVEVEAGRRSGGTSTTDYGFEVGQELELPQRRRARRDAARAGLTGEEQRARVVEGEVLARVATLFLRAVEARERASVATSGKGLAEEALRIAERRYAAGDVAQLDVNLARTAVARADAEERAARALLTGRSAQLQVLLGMTEAVTPGGSLHHGWTAVVNELVAHVAERPDVRVLDAEIAEVEAELRFARTLRWPDFGLRASYEHEEGDRVVMGGFGISLPIFARGQEASAVANARLARLRVEREALTRTIEAGVLGALATHDALRAAAAVHEQAVMPMVEENEKLAMESYEAGQIGLADLLVVRREALEARRAVIDQLIEVRLAEVELRTHAGAWK